MRSISLFAWLVALVCAGCAPFSQAASKSPDASEQITSVRLGADADAAPRRFDNVVIYVSDCSTRNGMADNETTRQYGKNLVDACEKLHRNIPYLLSASGLKTKVIRSPGLKITRTDMPMDIDAEQGFNVRYRLYLAGIGHGGDIHGYGGFDALDMVLEDATGRRIVEIGGPILQADLSRSDSVNEAVDIATESVLCEFGCNAQCFDAIVQTTPNPH